VIDVSKVSLLQAMIARKRVDVGMIKLTPAASLLAFFSKTTGDGVRANVEHRVMGLED
jgi:hypothetical protein